jgi:hypothetical protein
MRNEDYVNTSDWFAWKPVKTECGKWVWLKTIKRTVDERDEVYLGLLPKYFYCL